MDWNYLKYVNALATHGTLAKAAKALGIDLSTLSRNLQRLEREEKIKLFDRQGLTPEGRRWAQSAKEMNALVQGLKQETEKPVRFTTLEIFLNHFLIPLGEFPDHVHFIGADRSLNLARREADLAVRFGRPEGGDYLVQKLCDVGHAVYCGKNAKKPEGWVLLNDDFESIEDTKWFYENHDPKEIKHKVSSCEQIIRLLEKKPLYGILPCYAGSGLRRVSEVIFRRTAWIITHRESSHDPAIKALKENLQALVRQNRHKLEN